MYSYTYNLNNQPTGISFAAKTIAFNYQWNRLVSSTLPNGITTDYQYNANSWLTYITAEQGTAALSEYNYSFDNVGNITNKNTEHGNYLYSYDATYQLTNSISPSLQEPFTYDNTGNRLTDSSTPTNLSFGTTEYIYNSRNRLETVNLPDGRTASYSYDPFNRRVRKEIAGQVTYYAYSDEGLIGEYSQSGDIQKAYGWRPDSIWGTDPVFIAENGQYYFYHNDHLGTPQKLTDIEGNTVWNATYTAFGKAQVQVASLENNLRFPGQYFDQETGLHYNWNRYYDTTKGSYTQEDPIGFASSLNRYSYSKLNPINMIDQLGLAWGTKDFWEHYKVNSNNKDVRLEDIGLYYKFWNASSVQSSMMVFKDVAIFKANLVARSLCGKCDNDIKTAQFQYGLLGGADVTSVPGLWAIGGVSLFRNADCSVTANCKNRTFSYSCKLKFHISDLFDDALDIFNSIPGKQDLYYPYKIKSNFEGAYSGNGNL